MLSVLSLNVVNSQRRAAQIEITVLQGNDILRGLDQFYYANCEDPASAPTLTIAHLASADYIQRASQARTPLLSADMTPSVSFTAPRIIGISIPAKSEAIAQSLQRAFGRGTLSGTVLTIQRVPSLYDLEPSSDRNTFNGLFTTPKCLI